MTKHILLITLVLLKLTHPSFGQQSLLNDEALTVSTNTLIYSEEKVAIGTTTNTNIQLTVSGNLLVGQNVNTNLGGILVNTFSTDGSDGGTVEISWASSNYQSLTVSENITLTFEDPVSPRNLILLIQRTGTGNITWPSSVKWPDNATPNFAISIAEAASSTAEDITGFYFDGTNYLGSASLNFQ